MKLFSYFIIISMIFYIYLIISNKPRYFYLLTYIIQKQAIEYDADKSLMKLGDKPCERVRRIFNQSSINCNENCLNIDVYARYGNSFVSFLTAIGIARGIGMKRIVIPPNFLFLNESFNYGNISIEINEKRDETCFHNFFYKIPKEMQPLISRYVRTIDPEFQSMYLKKFPKVNIPENSLVVHIRGSNIFRRRRPHWKYGQPPCSYYLDIIRMKEWNKVILIAEDRKNPCVNVIEKFTEGFVSRSFFEDMSFILHAKNLVISRSTLTNAMVTLSPNLENLYSFNHSRFFDVNVHNCVPTDHYFNNVIKVWKNNRLQIDLMMKSKSCAVWQNFSKKCDRQIRRNLWDID